MPRKISSSHDSKKYFDWLDRAGEDILSARILCNNDKCYNAAAFHCQQTIEKALKAYILLRSNLLVDGHSLPWLCKKAAKYDAKFNDWLSDSSTLSKCYIETRYPSDIALDMEYNQLSKYYDIAKEMYLFICKEVDKFLQDNF